LDFWFENKPSGNPDARMQKLKPPFIYGNPLENSDKTFQGEKAAVTFVHFFTGLRDTAGVARFFLEQQGTKTGKKFTNRPQNIPTVH
jgi:hypothetical protein